MISSPHFIHRKILEESPSTHEAPLQMDVTDWVTGCSVPKNVDYKAFLHF